MPINHQQPRDERIISHIVAGTLQVSGGLSTVFFPLAGALEKRTRSSDSSSPRLSLHAPPQEIPHLDRLGEVIDLVTMLPFDPDVFDADVALVFNAPHRLQDTSVINRIFFEGRLQTSFVRTRA